MSAISLKQKRLAAVALVLTFAVLLIVGTSHDSINVDLLDNVRNYADNSLTAFLEPLPANIAKLETEDPDNPGGFLGDMLENDPYEDRPMINDEDPDADEEPGLEFTADGELVSKADDPSGGGITNGKGGVGTLKEEQEFTDVTLPIIVLPEKPYPEVPVPRDVPMKQPLPFRIYTHNIKNGNHAELAPGERPWSVRMMHVVASIKLHTAPNTIVLLQEALSFQIDDILTQLNILKDEWIYYGVGREDGKRVGEHVPILLKKGEWEVIYDDNMYLNPLPRKGVAGWDAKYPRIATYVTLKSKQNGAYINVFNTHFDHKGKEARLELAKLLRSKMAPNKWPTILCGDLNASENDKCYNELSKSYMDVHHLTAAYNRYGHRADTVTGFLGNYLKNAKRIDYIFASDYTVKASAKVCQKATTPFYLQVQGYGILHSKFDGFYMSDHRPVVADFVLGGCNVI